MTDSARYGNYTPAAAGTPYEPRPGWPTSAASGTVEAASDGLAAIDDEISGGPGIDAVELTDSDLLREMGSLHRTRLDTLRHGTDAALANHLRRTADLETEYLTRHPGREVDTARLRDGR